MTASFWLPRRTRVALVLGGWCQALWLFGALVLTGAALGAHRTHVDFATFSGLTGTTPGQIVAVTPHERWSRGGTWTIYEHEVTWSVDGIPYDGSSWSTREQAPGDCEVEFVAQDPRTARVVGMSTRPNGPAGMLAGLVLVFGALAWTLTRVSSVELRGDRIRQRLLQQKPYTSHGFFPKVRLDRDDRLVTFSPVVLLVSPVTALAALVVLFATY